jgi:hypothetical protein
LIRPDTSSSLRGGALAAGLILLAGVAYAPFLALPPLPDDYLQVELALRYGAPARWGELLRDPLYHSRATSIVATYISLLLWGYKPLWLNLTSLLLHGINGFLVYRLGLKLAAGRWTAILAAILFTLRERHHEAVVWYAAQPELFLFTFALITLLLWLGWLGGSRAWEDWRVWAALGTFSLTLLSKESGVAVVALMALVAWPTRSRRTWLAILPFAVLAAVAALAVFVGAEGNHHFRDGTFRPAPAFARTLANSAARGFWVWGLLASLVVVLARKRRQLRLAGLCVAWVLVALLPYSFVSYMPRIPSRHHYLASVGYCLLISVAMVLVTRATGKSWMRWALITVFACHNVGYVWHSKYPMFEQRAQAIESALEYGRTHRGRPIRLLCFPFNIDEARRAFEMRLGEPRSVIADEKSADLPGLSFCGGPAKEIAAGRPAAAIPAAD